MVFAPRLEEMCSRGVLASRKSSPGLTTIAWPATGRFWKVSAKPWDFLGSCRIPWDRRRDLWWDEPRGQVAGHYGELMLYHFDRFSLDPDRRELRRDGTPISVEPKVFDLIIYLLDRRDRVVSKDDLISAVWHGRIVSESALATCINAARAALGDSGEEQRLIKTFPRKGLRFIGTVLQGPIRACGAGTAAGRARAA